MVDEGITYKDKPGYLPNTMVRVLTIKDVNLPPERGIPVNVSTVPQRSPFRYPGGKSWLVPYIRLWLCAQPQTPRLLVEPFAGGGIVTLTAIAENLVENAVMVELDECVASVWETVLNGHGLWLANRISSFELTPESVATELARSPRAARTLAFRTILLNRVRRGGILAPGAGLLKNGEGGKGLGSRWYPETLKKRIESIVEVKDRIEFVKGDGIQALREYKRHASTVFFIDPPYVAANKNRLYTHGTVDHEAIFAAAAELEGDFLMTYDATDVAVKLAEKHGFDTDTVIMRSTNHSRMQELLIGRDLGWVL